MDDVPIGTIELLDDSILLHNLALIDPAEVDIVAALIDELLMLVDCDPAANIRHILVVPEIDSAGYVDHAVRRLMNGAPVKHEPPTTVPRTGSFPVAGELGLTTFIIVNESIMRGLTPENSRKLELISALLDSLLHAHFHARTCPTDLLNTIGTYGSMESGSVRELAAKTLEAYLSYRTKIAIMSTHSLVRMDVDSELKPLYPRTPVDTAARLDRSSEEVRAVVCSATSGRIAPEDAWSMIRRTLFRGLLDPLARHSAYQDHAVDGAPLAAALKRSPFYVSDIAPFWDRAGAELRLAYESQSEISACIDTLETLLDRFLNHLGICAALDAVALHFDMRWAGAYAHQ